MFSKRRVKQNNKYENFEKSNILRQNPDFWYKTVFTFFFFFFFYFNADQIPWLRRALVSEGDQQNDLNRCLEARFQCLEILTLDNFSNCSKMTFVNNNFQ